METPQRAPKSLWTFVFIAALAAATIGFILSYQDEQTRFSEMGLIAESHLNYALQLKDDMALIDWSKGLEKLPSISAFQAVSDSKVVAEGGNKQLCPPIAADGISFQFPYRWMVHFSFRKDSVTPIALTLVFQDLRGPLFWGLFTFLACLGLGWALIGLGGLSKKLSSFPESTVSPLKNDPTVVKPIVSIKNDESFTLVLDKDYIICQVTASAAKALGRQVSELVGNHFLDLLPDPTVMKAIEESKEIKLLKPFPSHPELSALLRPVPEGTILIFETQAGSQRA
jgi:hypothetical protein